MAETEELEVNLFDFSDEELIKELLDDKTPFFLLPTAMEPEPSLEPEPEPEPGLDRHFANFYSGPTIGDIEAALTATQQNRDSEQPHVPLSTVSLLQKGFERSKMENKYTLKIKSNGNWIGEDGYKWRKYGQKSIKNSPNPRSYYRCTNPRCSAKKQVERSKEDPDTLVVTYEGLHLHFAYSHFQLRELQPHRQFPHLLNPNNKRPKTLPGPTTPQPTVGPTAPQIPLMAGWHQQPQPQPSRLNSMETVGGSSGPPFIVEPIKSPQGFLEDMVPSLIRNPLNDPFSSYTPSLSCSSPSSLSSCSIASSSFVSWSPSSPFDVDIVSASTSTR